MVPANDNDVFRKNYTPVTEENKERISHLKTLADQLYVVLNTIPNREGALSRTKLEESVMWAVKALTAKENN
jgi:hypothetical protein